MVEGDLLSSKVCILGISGMVYHVGVEGQHRSVFDLLIPSSK